jgi:DNA-binding HxlR family transcriptional regulator
MAVLDLLGRRKILRILWELRESRLNFRALLAAAETNPSILNLRLQELRALGLIDHDGSGYGVTAIGAELLKLLMPLDAWSKAWAGQLGTATAQDRADAVTRRPARSPRGNG